MTTHLPSLAAGAISDGPIAMPLAPLLRAAGRSTLLRAYYITYVSSSALAHISLTTHGLSAARTTHEGGRAASSRIAKSIMDDASRSGAAVNPVSNTAE